MVSYEQIENGLVAWLDAELPVNGKYDALKKAAVTTAALYYLKIGGKLLDRYAPTLRSIGAMDETGNVDLDGVADIFKTQVPGEGISISIPMVGPVTFYKADVDTIKKYIMKG